METSAPPTCRICGHDIAPNARGDYVACCSPFVAPPARKNPLREFVRPWLRGVEWLFLDGSRGLSRYARLVIVLGSILLATAGLLTAFAML